MRWSRSGDSLRRSFCKRLSEPNCVVRISSPRPIGMWLTSWAKWGGPVRPSGLARARLRVESHGECRARPAELVLVLDSAAVTRLAERTPAAAALILALRDEGLWPPLVPSFVLVECLQGHAGRDASENKFLKTCDVREEVSEHLARRAAFLRRRARRGSAIDALVVASAEPDGTVLTSDPRDLEALASYAERVRVERI